MPSDADTAEILAELRELRAAIKPKRKSPSDRQPLAICRLQPEEIAALDAAAVQRGLSRSELMRQCITTVIGIVLKPRQPTPAGLAAHNRRKPSRFDDGKSDTRALLALKARDGIIAQRMLARDDARQSDAMLGEPAVPIVPKLPKSGG